MSARDLGEHQPDEGHLGLDGLTPRRTGAVSGWSPPGTTVWGGRPVARRCAEAGPRQRAVLRGTVGDLRVRRMAGGVALEGTLEDGTGRIVLRWLGRHGIAGLADGTAVLVEGTVGEHRGRLVLLDPLVALGGQAVDTAAGREGPLAPGLNRPPATPVGRAFPVRLQPGPEQAPSDHRPPPR